MALTFIERHACRHGREFHGAIIAIDALSLSLVAAAVAAVVAIVVAIDARPGRANRIPRSVLLQEPTDMR